VSTPILETPLDEKPFRYWPNLPQFAMLVFLGSLVVFFGAIIAVYAFTLAGREAPQAIRVPAALWWSTLFLLLSGPTLARARWMLRYGRAKHFQGWLGVSIVLAIAFLVSQSWSSFDLFGQGVYVRGNPHGSVFYAFTAFHAFHLIGGIGSLSWLFRESFVIREDREQSLRKARNRSSVVAMYWNFVIVSWVVLFALLLYWVS
jgi:cytochrome c oxidase subunit III